MKTKFLKYISVLFIIAWPVMLHSQTINTTAVTVSNCPGDIVVPVSVTNCNNVGAISLVIEYNDAILAYQNYEAVNTQLSSGLLIVNQTVNRIIVSWASTTAANIGDDLLMQFRFTGVTGSSSLTWDTQTSGNCEYSDASGNIIPSSYTNGTATVYQVPEVITPPTDATVLVGNNATFTVDAIATGIQREWFRSINGGLNWISTGLTSSTITVYNVTLAMSGYLYRCEISGTCSPVAVSAEAELTVVEPLTTSFDVENVCPGTISIPVLASNFTDVAAFSLAFTYNTGTLNYSGYQNVNASLPGNFVCNEVNGMVYMSWSSTTPITFGPDTVLVEIQFSGTAGSSNLTWDLTTPGNCEYIYLNAENILSVFENNSFTIYALPEVTSQPLNRLIPENTNTSFSVSATGSGLNYQWQVSADNGGLWTDLVNGGYYNGSTTANLSVSNASLFLSGNWYRCVVGGYCTPDAISAHGELIVLPRITAIAGTESDCPGTIIVPIDVTHFIDVASFSLSLKYDENVLTFDNYQSLNGAFSGSNFTLNATGGSVYFTWSSTTPVTIGDDQLIELVFTGITGVSVLDWENETEGNCEFSDIYGNIIFDNYVNGNVSVYQIPEITGNPVNKTAPQNTSTSFSVSAVGTGLLYLWQESDDNGNTWNNLVNGSPYSGVNTATLTINPVNLLMDEYQYRCRVSGTCPPVVYSDAAVLHVIPPIISTSAGSVTNSCTGNISVPITVSNCNNVGAISLVLNFDNTKLTFDGYELPNTELSSGMLIVNSTESQVILSWASITPANIGFGTLINYKFMANAGISTTLSWDTQSSGSCEYSDPDGNIFAMNFNNGTVSTTANALIVDAGMDESIIPGGSVQLNGSASGGSTPYNIEWTPGSWLSSTSIFNPIANPPATTSYTLTVTDDVGCTGSDEMTVEVATAGIDLDLKVFLEGPYEGSVMGTYLNGSNLIPLNHPYSGPPWNYSGSENVPGIPNTNISDWVLVELRETAGGPSTATNATIIAQQAGFLLKGGSIVSTSGSNNMHFDVSVTQNLYVVVKHRNHLPIMSSGPLSNSGPLYSWDFTTAITKAYGTNAQADLGGAFGMYAGDADANGTIQMSDKTSYWNPAVGKSAYLPGDFDLNSEVNNQDKNEFWLKNLTMQEQIPD
ncbi:MAG: hypothetical protein K9H58_08260 [Bacteroidales bacterium]|nr:hypothetical protein [Bacteroidales bacterium]